MMEAETAVLGTLLTSIEEPQQAPGKIEFAAWPKGRLSVQDGSDHLIWTIAIGKDHTATVLMHKDAWDALKEMMK